MKSISKYLAIAAIAATAVSCDHNVSMGTIINADGSCHREIIINADSASIVGGYAIIGKSLWLDSTWTRSCGIEGTLEQFQWNVTPEQYDSLRNAHPGKRFFVRYSRDFDSVDELCAAFPYSVCGKQVAVKGHLSTSTHWLIFTDYTYTETYTSLQPLFSVPLDGFLTAEEAQIWTTGNVIRTSPDGSQYVENYFAGHGGSEIKDKLDEIEIKVNRWIHANEFNDVCNYILSHYNEIPSMTLSPDALSAIRDSILLEYHNVDYPNVLSQFAELAPIKEYIDRLDDKVDIPGGSVHTTGHAVAGITEHFEALHDFSADYTLKLPGEMISAGTGLLKDGLAQYRLTGERLVPADYVITATSRKLNFFAVLILGLIAVGSAVAVRIIRK